jgi:cell division protein FtsW (lipid II flippase)
MRFEHGNPMASDRPAACAILPAGFCTGLGMNEVNTEAKAIEHELDILRSRHALMQRSAQWTKFAFVIFVAVMAVLAVTAVTMGVVLAALVSIAVLVVIGLLALASPGARWIDIVTPERFAPRTFAPRRSEAQIVEEQIAEREQRLAQIKGLSS